MIPFIATISSSLLAYFLVSIILPLIMPKIQSKTEELNASASKSRCLQLPFSKYLLGVAIFTNTVSVLVTILSLLAEDMLFDSTQSQLTVIVIVWIATICSDVSMIFLSKKIYYDDDCFYVKNAFGYTTKYLYTDITEITKPRNTVIYCGKKRITVYNAFYGAASFITFILEKRPDLKR